MSRNPSASPCCCSESASRSEDDPLGPQATLYDLLLGQPLLAAAIVLLAGTLSALGLASAHGLYAVRRRARRGARLKALRGVLVTAIVGERAPDEAARALAVLSERDRIRLFVDVGRALSGSDRARLQEVARRLRLVDRGEAWCTSRTWWRRLHGVRLLHVVGGGTTLIPGLVEDPSAEVRREAVRWIAERAGPKDVARILRLADTPSLLDPITVIDALMRAGPAAVAPMRTYLEDPDPGPGLVPVLQAAVGLGDPTLAAIGARFAAHPDAQVRRHTARLLAHGGSGTAMATLRRMLADPDPDVRRAAVEGLGESHDWREAVALSPLLADPDGRVRQATALALRRFGSPGILLLREALRSRDPLVRRTARHVLDLPDTADFGGSA